MQQPLIIQTELQPLALQAALQPLGLQAALLSLEIQKMHVFKDSFQSGSFENVDISQPCKQSETEYFRNNSF